MNIIFTFVWWNKETKKNRIGIDDTGINNEQKGQNRKHIRGKRETINDEKAIVFTIEDESKSTSLPRIEV